MDARVLFREFVLNTRQQPLPERWPQPCSQLWQREQGFTLIELLVVMVIMAILAVSIGFALYAPMRGYNDLDRRTMLVDIADNALRHIARDIRQAVPNSVRVSGDTLELLPVKQGGRYRSKVSGVAGSDPLDFTTPDSSFHVLGNLQALSSGDRLVIYNIGQTNAGVPVAGANVYAGASSGPIPPAGSHVISPMATTLTLTSNDQPGEDRITLSAPFQFAFPSPNKRFYLASQPVSYHCDESAGTLVRITGYNLSVTQQTPPTGNSALLAEFISQCRFVYQPGTPSRGGVVTLEITLADQGDTITLLHQVSVTNTP